MGVGCIFSFPVSLDAIQEFFRMTCFSWRILEVKGMTLKRMDNILIVVEDMEAARAFFFELFMELEGEMPTRRRLCGPCG